MASFDLFVLSVCDQNSLRRNLDLIKQDQT
jgi:hypothetical protein